MSSDVAGRSIGNKWPEFLTMRKLRLLIEKYSPATSPPNFHNARLAVLHDL
jgi:hypothetical protein